MIFATLFHCYFIIFSIFLPRSLKIFFPHFGMFSSYGADQNGGLGASPRRLATSVIYTTKIINF